MRKGILIISLLTVAQIMSAQQVLTLEGFKNKSAQNLINAIENSKKANLDKLIFAFGIRNVGEKAAVLLAEKFKTLDNLINADIESIIEIDGFGETVANCVTEYFAKDTVKEVIQKLKNACVNTEYISTKTGDKLAGKTFVVTGTLPSLSRDEAELLIADNGGKAVSSVSKKTSNVIAGAEAGSKLDKAKTLGIPVIDEQEFMNMINN